MLSPLALTLTRRSQPQINLLIDAILILVGSLFVAAFAQISIPLSFTPVPITGQTFAVLIVGASLGSKRGALSLLLYVIEGAAGLPVYAEFTGGLGRLLGPSGGYLIGFIAAAFVVGWLAERGLDRRWSTAIIPFLVGTVIIYIVGASWLAIFIGPGKALIGGVIPFLIGDAIKLVLAAIALPSAWALVKAFDRS